MWLMLSFYSKPHVSFENNYPQANSWYDCVIPEDAAKAALPDVFHQRAAETHKPSACRFLLVIHPKRLMFGKKAVAGVCPRGISGKNTGLEL